jgi:hypothetical protein
MFIFPTLLPQNEVNIDSKWKLIYKQDQFTLQSYLIDHIRSRFYYRIVLGNHPAYKGNAAIV